MVTLAKCLGVTIHHNIKWNTHINKITIRVNRSLRFLRRNFQVNSPELKIVTYNALVRSLLEYALSVWDPHTKWDLPGEDSTETCSMLRA